jgi:putative chitinase
MNLEKLKGHVPDTVIAQIPAVQVKFEVNTPLRLAHFLAAKGLMAIFKKYFPTEVLANAYARQPQKIANRVYGGRMGNGLEATGEGFKFRGRGYIQLTGKQNYTAFDKTVEEDILATPDLVATKYPLLSAAWFFYKNGLQKIADEGATDAVVTKITKRVNGGTIGLPDRIKHFNEYNDLLKVV